MLTGLLRQSVFGRLAGSEDVNDAERLAHDSAMRAVTDRTELDRQAAPTSQMGRFETEWLTTEANLAALAICLGLDRPGACAPSADDDRARHGQQRQRDPRHAGSSASNGHYACTCYHPLFVFNQFGDLEHCELRPGNVHNADGWRNVLEPVAARYRQRMKRRVRN